MKKILFFDADGTILDIKKGVPESAKIAIKKLTDNGHEAFLCTGRSYSYVPKEVLDMAFTGFIANCGAFISYKDKVILDKRIPNDIAKKSVEILRECGMIPVMEGTDYMFFDPEEYTTEVDWFATLTKEQLGEKWKPIRGNIDNLDITKISAKRMPGCDYDKAVSLLSEHYDAIKHDEGLAGKTTEFVPKGFSKGFAIAILLGVLGYKREDAICFGDSNNDISMFEACGYRVAMGNSSPEIIKRADIVTDDIFHDGIYHGLEKLELI